MRSIALALTMFLPVACLAAEPHGAVLLISIDGMRPDYVTQATAHGLKIPHLEAMLREGAHASGVRGVLPTVTYPSHTTILTGVWPARHGIGANTTFDPLDKNLDGWYWYSQDIRVPTLWDAAANAGLRVASVSWPVSAGARGVQTLIPEYWRANTPEDLKLLRLVSTSGLLDELQGRLGPYLPDSEDEVAADRQRTRYAAAIVSEKRPQFVTVHLGSLDRAEHQSGPFSPEANATLEQLDGMVGELADAMRKNFRDAVVCVVSDHGFTRVDHHLHILTAFAGAGLITLDSATVKWPHPRVLDWKAMPWISGGSAAVVLRNSDDKATSEAVKKLLARLAADPANGIAQILDRSAIAAQGGAADSAFWIDMRSNYSLDSVYSESLVSVVKVGGSHGYAPSNPELLASFFVSGGGVPAGFDLGQIDMRSIAPTLAHLLGVRLPSAELTALRISK